MTVICNVLDLSVALLVSSLVTDSLQPFVGEAEEKLNEGVNISTNE